MAIRKLDWIQSAGGPLILAPRSSLDLWSGSEKYKMIGSETDYDRACSIADEIGVISIGNAAALVLGDEPDRTAMLTESSAGEVLIVRWRWADSEEALLSALQMVDALPFILAGHFKARREEYLLFDSAFSGRQIDRYLSVAFEDGAYSIETAKLEPDRSTFALLHRLSLKGDVGDAELPRFRADARSGPKQIG